MIRGFVCHLHCGLGGGGLAEVELYFCLIIADGQIVELTVESMDKLTGTFL